MNYCHMVVLMWGKEKEMVLSLQSIGNIVLLVKGVVVVVMVMGEAFSQWVICVAVLLFFISATCPSTKAWYYFWLVFKISSGYSLWFRWQKRLFWAEPPIHWHWCSCLNMLGGIVGSLFSICLLSWTSIFHFVISANLSINQILILILWTCILIGNGKKLLSWWCWCGGKRRL